VLDKCSTVAEMGDRLVTIDMGRKLGRGSVPYGEEAGSPCNTIWPWLRPSFVPNGILIHPAVWPQHMPKLGGLCPLSWVCIKHNVARAEAYLLTKWQPDPSSRLATIVMGRKVGGGLCLILGRVAGSPSSTVWPGLKPTSISSSILIHPDVWLQHTLWVGLFPLLGGS